MTIKTNGKMKEISIKKEPTLKEQLKEAIINDTFYDFIANNYYKLSKDELCDLLKNYDYTRYQIEKNKHLSISDFSDLLLDNLNDYDFFNEE